MFDPEAGKEHTSNFAQSELRDRFEKERITRRAALRKFGVTSAMAVFTLFSVDDLANMVGKAIKQRAGDNQIAQRLSKELMEAGAVYGWSGAVVCQGNYSGPSPQGPCTDLMNNTNSLTACTACNNERAGACENAIGNGIICPPDTPGDPCRACQSNGTNACANGGNLYQNLNNAWQNCCNNQHVGCG